MSIQACYHEAGHALIARSMGRPVKLIAVSPDGGITQTTEPLAGDKTAAELEKALTIILAGEAAAGYAPAGPSPDAVAAADPYGGIGIVPEHGADSGPDDDQVVDVYRQRLGDETVERCRELAVELVGRERDLGQLGRVADALYLRGLLDAQDLEEILAAP